MLHTEGAELREGTKAEVAGVSQGLGEREAGTSPGSEGTGDGGVVRAQQPWGQGGRLPRPVGAVSVERGTYSREEAEKKSARLSLPPPSLCSQKPAAMQPTRAGRGHQVAQESSQSFRLPHVYLSAVGGFSHVIFIGFHGY